MPVLTYDLFGAIGILGAFLICALDHLMGCERNTFLGVMWLIVFAFNILYVAGQLVIGG